MSIITWINRQLNGDNAPTTKGTKGGRHRRPAPRLGAEGKPAGVPRAGSRQGGRPANAADVRKAAGAPTSVQPADAVLLTAPGGPLEVDEATRDRVAIFTDGRFYVRREYIHDSEIQSLAFKALPIVARYNPAMKDVQRLPMTTATLAELKQMYGSDAASNQGDTTEMRTRLIALLELASDSRVNEIQVSHTGEHAYVRFEIHGFLSDVVAEFTDIEVRAFFTVTFNYADEKPSTEQPNQSQEAAIIDEKKLPKGVFAARLKFLRKPDGRHLNIRLVYKDLIATDLSKSGLLPDALKTAYYLQTTTAGLLSMSGPIGSGKSTLAAQFLFSLSEWRDNRWFIVSAEDPPEGLDPRVTTVSVQNTADQTADPFEQAMLDILRIAPHVVRLGECRTAAAAAYVFMASRLGKMVITTVHADEALDIPERYEDLGIPRKTAFDAARHSGWFSQRLIPKICPKCAQSLAQTAKADVRREAIYDAFATAMGTEFANTLKVRGHDGCPHCQPRTTHAIANCEIARSAGGECQQCGTCDKVSKIIGMPGITGRILAAEVIRPTRALTERLSEDYDAARTYWLTEMHGKSMRYHAFTHLKAGLIGAEEYLSTVGSVDELAFDLKAMNAMP